MTHRSTTRPVPIWTADDVDLDYAPQMPNSAPATRSNGFFHDQTQGSSSSSSSSDDECVVSGPSSKQRVPYYHGLRLPLILGDAGETHTLLVCIHPDWRVRGSESAVHLYGLEATVKRQIHDDGDVLTLDYEPADLWGAWETYGETGQHKRGGIKQQIRPHSWPCSSGILDTFVSLLLALLMLVPGHPAWVLQSSHNTSLSIPLAQPISSTHNDWMESLVPILSPFQLNEPQSQARPMRLFSALETELLHVQIGLVSWNASSLTGPDPHYFTLIDQALASLPNSFPSLYRSAANLLKGNLASIVAGRIDKSETRGEVIGHIARYWNVTQGDNRAVLQDLHALQERLAGLKVV
ncbi:hypothetical protein ACHAPA_011948 [Fusarium lateritium]